MRLLAAAVLLLGAVPASAQVEARAAAAKAEVTVGEPFEVTVTATGPAGTTFTFPGEVATDQAELRTPPPAPGASPAPETPGRRTYLAAVFVLQGAAVPAIPVSYRLPDGRTGTVQTAPVPLQVGSLLPRDAKEQALADIRPPLPLRVSPWFWAGLALLAALALTLGWRIWRRRRPRRPAAAMVSEAPPAVEAQQALDGLAGSDLISRGELRAFYIALAEIAKRYLERRLDAPVLEMTSAEAVVFLQGRAPAGDLASVLRDVVAAADQVKFARAEGQRAEAERHLAAVRGLVATLEQRLAPPPAEKVA